jgi:hypothetical protein
MPLPPFQNDMRSQNLPPRTNIHATMHLTESPDSFSAVFMVTRPDELPAALRQHGKEVVIENTPANARLRRDFELLLKWQRWKDTYRLLLIVILAVIAFMQMVIANRYKLDADWHAKWNVYEMGGKITLTPP